MKKEKKRSKKEIERLSESELIAKFMGFRLTYNDYGCLFIGHIDMFSAEEMDISKRELRKLFNAGHFDAWFIHEDNIKYEISYNEIMEVVEEIESKGYISTIEKMSLNGDMHRVWFNEKGSLKEVANGSRDEDKLTAIYKAVIDFIRWYNDRVK